MAQMIWRCPPDNIRAPTQRPSSVIRSTTKLFSATRMTLALAGGVDERRGQFLAGGVAVGVNDAGKTVSAFAAKGQVVGIARLLVKPRPPGQQFQHPLRTLFDDDLDGLVVAETGPSVFGVVHVRLIAVGGLEHRRDAPLGIPGIGFGDRVLGDQEHFAPLLGSGDGRAQPRHPPADHQHIGELLRQARRVERNQVPARS